MAIRLLTLWLGLIWAVPVFASSLFEGRKPLFEMRQQSEGNTLSASLFSGVQRGSLFAAQPRAQSGAQSRALTGAQVSPQVSRLLDLIAKAEAGRAGYDAVQHGAHIRPPAPPTELTLGDIYQWIDDTPGQHHAIGRYQFIPPTLKRVARIREFGPETRFTPAVQDALAEVLLRDAGLRSFQAGEMGKRKFMHNLARIWAGLPLPNGKSYYEGYAGNKATMTWNAFYTGVSGIWPAS